MKDRLIFDEKKILKTVDKTLLIEELKRRNYIDDEISQLSYSLKHDIALDVMMGLLMCFFLMIGWMRLSILFMAIFLMGWVVCCTYHLKIFILKVFDTR